MNPIVRYIGMPLRCVVWLIFMSIMLVMLLLVLVVVPDSVPLWWSDVRDSWKWVTQEAGE